MISDVNHFFLILGFIGHLLSFIFLLRHFYASQPIKVFELLSLSSQELYYICVCMCMCVCIYVFIYICPCTRVQAHMHMSEWVGVPFEDEKSASGVFLSFSHYSLEQIISLIWNLPDSSTLVGKWAMRILLSPPRYSYNSKRAPSPPDFSMRVLWLQLLSQVCIGSSLQAEPSPRPQVL